MYSHVDNRSRFSWSSTAKPLIQPSAHSVSGKREADPKYTAPRKIGHSKAFLALDLIVDAVLLAVGSAFLALAVASHRFDGEPVSENQEVADILLGMAFIGPTLLPIAFAVMVGRACKSIFMWRLERGEQIGTLDLLAGSTSLASALLTHFTLRSFIATLSPVLLVVWALSPIGSQASLRVVTTVDARTSEFDREYSYLTSNYTDELYEGSNSLGDFFYSLAVWSMLSPTKVKKCPRDLWLNPKVPMIEPFEHNANAPTDEGWYAVGNTSATVYSALLGTPIANISSEASHTGMDLEVSYWRLRCEPLFESEPGPDALDDAWQRLNCDNSLSREFPELERCLNFSQTIPLSDIDDDAKAFAACSMGTTYVDLHVDCERGLCAATHIRRSRLPGNPPPSWTYLDRRGVENFALHLFGFLDTEIFINSYIAHPEQPTQRTHDVPLSTLDPDVFAVRYAQILNSFWASVSCFVGIDNAFYKIDSSMGKLATTLTTQGHETFTAKVIRYHRAWMCILVAASLIMVLATVLHVALLFIIKAPKQVDINVSSLVRDNRYVLFPMTGSAADASEQARRVKSCYVQYGDVQPDEEVGHLAIGSVDEKDGTVERVRRDRYYD